MSDPKRHHYVPQFHLRRFGFGDGNGQIHRFDKTDGSIARASVKGSAYEDDYYTLPAPDGSRDTGIEAMFSRVESNAAPATARLLALGAGQRHAISDDDRIAVALYLALLHGRVPGAREPVEDLADFMGKLWLDMQLSNPEAHRAGAVKRGAEDNPEQIEADPVEMLESLRAGTWKVKPPEGWSMLQPLDIAIKELGPRLTAMNWYLVPRHAAPFFVIGDHPVVPCRTEDHSPHQGVGIGTSGVEVIVPLSSEVLMILKDEDHDGLVTVLPAVPAARADAQAAGIVDINEYEWWRTERYIFARDPGDLEAVRSHMGVERALRTPQIVVSGMEDSWRAYQGNRVRAADWRPASSRPVTPGHRADLGTTGSQPPRTPKRRPSWGRRRR